MAFFKTDDGILHVGRIAGLFYNLALLVRCGLLNAFDRQCLMETLFMAGWWLALGEKQVPRTFGALTANPRRMLGTILAAVGIAGQFYLTWAGHRHS